MLKQLEHFQELASHFQYQLLTGPGVLLVIAGLCVCLAGLRWRKLLTAILAAGGISVFLWWTRRYSNIVVAGSAAVAAILGAAIDKVVMGIIAVIIAVFIALLICVWPAIWSPELAAQTDPNAAVVEWEVYKVPDGVIKAPESLEITTSFLGFSSKRFGAGLAGLSMSQKAIAGFTAIAATVLAAIVPKVFISTTFAALGTFLIFEGMILLLLYKGSEPFSIIAANPGFYGLAFLAMVAFGTLVQLALNRSASKEKKKKKSSDEGDEK